MKLLEASLRRRSLLPTSRLKRCRFECPTEFRVLDTLLLRLVENNTYEFLRDCRDEQDQSQQSSTHRARWLRDLPAWCPKTKVELMSILKYLESFSPCAWFLSRREDKQGLAKAFSCTIESVDETEGSHRLSASSKECEACNRKRAQVLRDQDTCQARRWSEKSIRVESD